MLSYIKKRFFLETFFLLLWFDFWDRCFVFTLFLHKLSTLGSGCCRGVDLSMYNSRVSSSGRVGKSGNSKIASIFNFELQLPPLPGQMRLDEVRVEAIGSLCARSSRFASLRDPARARVLA